MSLRCPKAHFEHFRWPLRVDDDAVEDDNDPDWKDDNNEINTEAYDTEDTSGSGPQKSEQAGVMHLVHRWTQQGHPDEVCAPGDTGFLCSSL